jgi:hypothetical protein
MAAEEDPSIIKTVAKVIRRRGTTDFSLFREENPI